MGEKEKKKISLSAGQVFLIILITAILTLVLFVGGYLLKDKVLGNNTKTNTFENDIDTNSIDDNDVIDLENTETDFDVTDIFSDYMKKSLEVTDRFVISSAEEKDDSYELSIYLLKDDVVTLSEDSYNKIVKEGARILFRGQQYKYLRDADSTGTNESKAVYLTNKLDAVPTEGQEFASLELRKAWDNETNSYKDEYCVCEIAGKGAELRDYATKEPITLKIKKNIKVGNSFESFKIAGSEVLAIDYENNVIQQDESTTKEFVMNKERYNAMTTYGECEAYLLEGEIVAIKTFEASAP